PPPPSHIYTLPLHDALPIFGTVIGGTPWRGVHPSGGTGLRTGRPDIAGQGHGSPHAAGSPECTQGCPAHAVCSHQPRGRRRRLLRSGWFLRSLWLSGTGILHTTFAKPRGMAAPVGRVRTADGRDV